MAYLNVRERRIEAKIAYVGSQLSGKTTNLERLGKRQTSDSDVMSVEWRPDGTTFRDCEVSVRIVARRGILSADQLQQMLRDVDGLVFIADATPGAEERNRAALAAVREALAAAPARDVPIVVQVNKSDVPDAIPADEVVRGLDAGGFPHVSASATRGDGVVETAERALAAALESLQRRGTDIPSIHTGSTVAPGRPTIPVRGDRNPLLTALRHVLRETVSEHVGALEQRVLANLEGQLSTWLDRATASGSREGSEIAALRRTLIEESARTRNNLDSMRERLDATQRAIVEMTTAMGTTSNEAARSLAEQSKDVAAIDDALQILTRDHHAGLDRVFGEVRAEIARASGELRAEVARASSELRTLTERTGKEATTVAATLKRAFDALATEVKAADSRPALDAVQSKLGGVAAQADALTTLVKSASTAVHGLPGRIGDVEGAVQREVRDGASRVAGRVEEGLTTLRGEATDVLNKTEANAGEIRALVQALIDELQKRKKGWFG